PPRGRGTVAIVPELAASDQCAHLMFAQTRLPCTTGPDLCQREVGEGTLRSGGNRAGLAGLLGLGIHSLDKTAINDTILNGAPMHEVRANCRPDPSGRPSGKDPLVHDPLPLCRALCTPASGIV